MGNIILTENQIRILKEFIDDNLSISLPSPVLNALKEGKTSLGKHPSFPPDDEKSFEEKLLSKDYKKTVDNIKLFLEEGDNYSVDGCKTYLSKSLKRINKIEQPIREYLEKLCIDTIIEIFNISKEDVELNVEIVDGIDSSDVTLPLQSEDVEEIEFEGVEEIEGINNEIYKRRLIDSLMQGIADWYIINPELKTPKILVSKNPVLYALYSLVLVFNDYILYNEDVNKFRPSTITQGSVSEVIVKKGKRSVVNVKGVNFIVLLRETIKAMFDLISFNGLPEDTNKANYILKKSDFGLSYGWDKLFGLPLWNLIIKDNNNPQITPILFNEIITKPTDEFNSLLKNVFANTKKGKESILSMCDSIRYNLDKEEFEKNVEEQRKKYAKDNNFIEVENL